jgi:drug/metabolite transporter (DMT)-like permease
MLAGGLMLTVAGGLSGEFGRLALDNLSLKSGMALGYLILFGSLIGFSAYMWLVKNTSPARASSNFYVNPLVAVFLGWLLAGETLTGRTLVAAAIIAGAVVLIVSHKRK